MRSICTSALFFFTALTPLFAQNGEINGDVRNTDSVLLDLCEVLLRRDGQVVRYISSNNGYFSFKGISPGNYQIEVIYEGEHDTTDVVLNPGSILVRHLVFHGTQKIIGVTVRPLLKEERPNDPVEKPLPNPISILGPDPSIVTNRQGFYVTGNRPDATAMIKDGLRLIGPTPLVGLGLVGLDAVWTGVPVRYGDFTGGAARFTTATPSLKSQKSIEVYSSSLFNPYHHNRLHTYMTGPLIIKQLDVDSSSRMKERMVLGYNFSTFFIYQKDPNPGFTGVKSLTDQALAEIEQNPVTTAEQMNSFVPSASFLSPDQIQTNKARNHAGYTDAAVEFNLHYAPGPYLTFDINNNLRYTRDRIYSFNNSLLNEARNPLRIQTNYAGYITVNHILRSPYTFDGKNRQDSSDLFSDLMYSIQIDYQTRNVTTMDPTHHDRIFDYGYIGSTSIKRAPVYSYTENKPRVVTDQYGNEVVVTNYHELTGYEDTALTYTPGNVNPLLARYNQIIFDGSGDMINEAELVERGGLLNGQNPANVYSLFNNVGTVTSGYSKVHFERMGITAFSEATFHPNRNPMVKHDLQFGLQYEQYTQSYYSLNAAGLWRLMPLLVNAHIEDVDKSRPFLTYDDRGRFTDTIKYPAFADPGQQHYFDRQLREKLISEGYRNANGELITSTTRIDMNSIDPALLSLNMFSADELLNDGNAYVAYSGYDHTGKRRRGRTGIADFLNDPLHRPVDSYSPILSAAWLQDQFQIHDIIFRAGIRVERFDANQYVLADPYSLFPVKTAGQARMDHPGLNITGNIKDDYLVYVDDINSPTKVTGYRLGDQWFDAGGNTLDNPEVIATQTARGDVQPLLVNPGQSRISSNSFREYKPVINLLPRLSFYFPMNSTAMFFANYDQLAQRPPDAQTFVPLSTWYNFQSALSSVIPNASLKPRVKTEYLVGFKQLIGKFGTLTLSANYATIRNDFNQVRISQAYPYSYTTYANIDFSTVKSFKVAYSHVADHISIHMGYNLQYADGTGSNINAAQTLIQSGQPNLRSLYPLSYDVRHAFSGSLALYANSRDPQGKKKPRSPVTTWEKVKENGVISISWRSYSGLPFTAIAQPVSEAQTSLGLLQRSQVKGNPFGSRMPWKVYVDARIEKSFILKADENFGVVTPRKTLDVFLVADNLFNLKIIENIYRFTGRPGDDGYLNSPVGTQQAQNQLDQYTFRMLYDIKLQNPLNYYNPRLVQIGFRFNFL